MNAMCAFAAGVCVGAALYADGKPVSVWVRWLCVTMAMANLWVGSL